MKEWLTVIALHAVTLIHAMAFLIVVFGTDTDVLTAVPLICDRLPPTVAVNGVPEWTL